MEKVASQTSTNSKPITTFVHTDTNAFQEIVQRLTGPSESNGAHEGVTVKAAGVRKMTSKLHERRQYMRPKLEIAKPSFHLKTGGTSDCLSPLKPGHPAFLSSPLGTPSKIFSKLSLFEEENKDGLPALIPELNREEEEKAIKERRFYLHPSPRSRYGHTQPELLTLFPLTSPKTSNKPCL